MTDERLKKLARNIMSYSCALKPGEKVLIELFDGDEIVAEELIRAAYALGAVPFVETYRQKVMRALLEGATEAQMKDLARYHSLRMSEMNAYVSFRGSDNSAEMAGVPKDRMLLYSSIYSKQVHSDLRVAKTKWVVLRYPNAAMAQLAGMSTRDFEDFYFDVCNLDYSKMSKAMNPLVALLEKTDRVRITAPGTDLNFSIRGIAAVKCAGNMNIPDGEVYTAPVRDSVNGTIAYNVPSTYQGFRYENVRLTFQNGKIVEATANNSERINGVFDTDEGARFVGEFALGVNPYITRPMDDILFDEKISGSIHFTPGSTYADTDNGNRSAIHWDLVLIQRPEWGGGEIWFDDRLIRKDGLFVLPELVCLNPTNLT